MAKLPPYAKQLVFNCVEVHVLTGKGAFERGGSPYWFAGQKIVLPFGEPIDSFRWPVDGLPCVVWSFGEPESYERIRSLVLHLVAAGAWRVVVVGKQLDVYRSGP